MALLLIPAVNVKAATSEPGDITVYLNDTSHKLGDTIEKDYLMNEKKWEDPQIFSVKSRKGQGYVIAQGVSLEKALINAGVIEEDLGELEGATLYFCSLSEGNISKGNSITYLELTKRTKVYGMKEQDGNDRGQLIPGDVTPILAVYYTDYKDNDENTYRIVSEKNDTDKSWITTTDSDRGYSSVAYRFICGMQGKDDNNLSCSTQNTVAIIIETEATEITLDKSELVFDNKTPQTLTVKEVSPASANLGNILNQVTWTSSDEKVATVSSDGTVTPVAKGTCTITASVSDTVKTEVKVTVNETTEVVPETPKDETTPSVTTPSKATISKAVSADYNKAKITWKKVSGANGYIVYRATSKSGTYKAVKTITKAATTSYTDTKLTTGKTYYYKVAAYTTSDGKKITGEKSAAKAVKIVPNAVSGLSVKNVKSKKAILTWKKVNGADGYVIYRASKENGTYKRVGTAKGTKYTSFRLTVGKTYYYKVRAYKGNKKVYGDYSAVKKVKIRK
jgi:hypothetical protein